MKFSKAELYPYFYSTLSWMGALQNALSYRLDGGVELLPGSRVLSYIVLLSDDAQALNCALDRLPIEVFRYVMCFAPSKRKLLPQEGQELCLHSPFVIIG